MANITAKDVAELRSKTSAGMMDCKKALVEANGNMEEAVKLLREKGLAAAAKKQERIAADGLVATLKKDGYTAIIEVNTETDFVAKNETFKEFVNKVLELIVANRPANVEELSALNYEGNVTVTEKLQELTFIIKEKLTIRRFAFTDGVTSTYVHGNGAIGVVVKFEADDAAVNNAGFAEFAKNIALQVAAYPVFYVDRAEVPESVLNEERDIVRAQIANDPKNASKPAQIIEKMVVGKLGKFYENNCLVDMEYFKEDKMTVGQYIAASEKALGGKIAVKAFWRYEKGEGIQKKEEDYAAEVAKLANGGK